MNVVKPIVGQWYRGGTNELFEVVAIDDQDETIEIQYFDGTVTEMEFDSWNEQLLDELIDVADAPEDWSGAVDVEAEDLDREFEDNARTAWSDAPGSLAAPLSAPLGSSHAFGVAQPAKPGHSLLRAPPSSLMRRRKITSNNRAPAWRSGR